MAVNTILLDFSVDSSLTKNEASLSILSSNVEEVLKEYLPKLTAINNVKLGGSLVKIYTAGNGTLVNIRIFTNGLITVNIDYFKEESDPPLMTFSLSKLFEQRFCLAVDAFRSKMFPPIKRGIPLDVYLSSSDERILEYDIDRLVFEEVTPFQKTQIVHSKSLGNMLVLDYIQNLSEADLIYTETLMQRGKENYKDKEILILGGGDGALLYELLKENPKEVLMIELDEVVMKACAKHMRSVCGDVLDTYDGPNYKIIVGDCMKAMEEYARDGRKFDYIFADLTDVPISEEHSKELWKFLNETLLLSFQVLKPDGKFMTHLTGTSSPDSLEIYKKYLHKMDPPVTYTMDKAFVPSFLEEWIFCQVSFVDQTKPE